MKNFRNMLLLVIVISQLVSVTLHTDMNVVVLGTEDFPVNIGK